MDFDPPVAIPQNAQSHGARGHLVEKPGEIEETLRTAVEHPDPGVADVLVHDCRPSYIGDNRVPRKA
jgi:benzoylformate decarboxylase